MCAGITILQPYLLTENLRIPFEEQGKASGLLALTAELVIIPMIAVFGALSDRVGRRAIYALGFAWAAIGFMMLPLAVNLPQLLSRLPNQFASMGYDTLTSGRLTYAVAATVAMVTAVVVFIGLKPGTGTLIREGAHLTILLRQGLQATRSSKRLIVACMEGLAARGDLLVIGTFFSLWAKQAGLDQGLTLEEAVKQAGLYAAIIQGSILFWAPLWGLILDRIDRLTGVCVAMLVAACGYTLVGFSSNPVGLAFIPAALLLGCGEIGAILSGQALVGQEAPEEARGSVIGLFMLVGGVGLLTVGFIGGMVFDAWMPGGVFILVACGNGVVFVAALLLRLAELRQTN